LLGGEKIINVKLLLLLVLSVVVIVIIVNVVFEQCVLAAVVIANLKGVFLQILDVRTLYRRSQFFDLVCSVCLLVHLMVYTVNSICK